MQVVIRSNDFTITKALRNFLHSQIKRSMAACSRNVESITIRLKDLNGPKGGIDKECLVEVKIANGAPVVVRKQSTNAYQGIRQALARAARVTLRRLRKARKHNSPVEHSVTR